jgi:predicted MPP superfamily phosphohydrolase
MTRFFEAVYNPEIEKQLIRNANTILTGRDLKEIREDIIAILGKILKKNADGTCKGTKELNSEGVKALINYSSEKENKLSMIAFYHNTPYLLALVKQKENQEKNDPENNELLTKASERPSETINQSGTSIPTL